MKKAPAMTARQFAQFKKEQAEQEQQEMVIIILQNGKDLCDVPNEIQLEMIRQDYMERNGMTQHCQR